MPFEAPLHGLRPRCLRFAGALTGCPRKTRFRLVANLYRAGFGPAGSPPRGFRSGDDCLHRFPLSQAYPGAQRLAPISRTWFDRTQEHVARRRRGEDPDPLQYTAFETVTFSPLPCWEHLSPEAYRERVGAMATEIEEEAAAARKRTGAHPLGAAKILAQHPWTRPERVKKSPAPLLHAASKAVRQIFYEGFVLFVAAYRTAAEKLKRGDPNPGFPFGSFPPALPFVGG